MFASQEAGKIRNGGKVGQDVLVDLQETHTKEEQSSGFQQFNNSKNHKSVSQFVSLTATIKKSVFVCLSDCYKGQNLVCVSEAGDFSAWRS